MPLRTVLLLAIFAILALSLPRVHARLGGVSLSPDGEFIPVYTDYYAPEAPTTMTTGYGDGPGG